MTRNGIIAAFVAISAVAVTAAPEHARLAAMCGTWNVEMTFVLRPGAAGITSKAISTIKPLLGGLFVEETIEGTLNGRPFTTLAWTGFNTSTKQYRGDPYRQHQRRAHCGVR